MYVYSDNTVDWCSYSNNELWLIFKKGNRNAFSELFSRFYHRLFRYGMSIVSDSDAVKDGIQELFLTLWRKRADLTDANSVEFYLLISLKRILFREKKKSTNRQKRNLEYIAGSAHNESGAESYLIGLENEEERYILYQKAIETLTGRQLETLMLRMEYGLDNTEIAALLDISEKSVRNFIYEATKKLREWIARREDLQIR